MPRFSIGENVKIIGGVAEHYPGMTAVVTEIVPHHLSHLCRYRVLICNQKEDAFYEFQLAPTVEDDAGTEQKKSI
jgi:hypothetical protein